MTIPQAIGLANAARPISYRERQEAVAVLKAAIENARHGRYHVLAAARQAHLDKFEESAPA